MRPGGQHDVLRQPALVEAAVRVLHHQHQRRLGAGQVPGEGTAASESGQRVSFADHNHMPGLGVL
jgi:hypothetical protein